MWWNDTIEESERQRQLISVPWWMDGWWKVVCVGKMNTSIQTFWDFSCHIRGCHAFWSSNSAATTIAAALNGNANFHFESERARLIVPCEAIKGHQSSPHISCHNRNRSVLQWITVWLAQTDACVKVGSACVCVCMCPKWTKRKREGERKIRKKDTQRTRLPCRQTSNTKINKEMRRKNWSATLKNRKQTDRSVAEFGTYWHERDQSDTSVARVRE